MTDRARRGVLPVLAIVAAVVVCSQAWAGTPVDGTNLARVVMFALPLAGIYAISATGLVVVYSATGIFNIAQGAIGMICAFVYWELHVNRDLPVWLSLILVVGVFAPLLGIILDRLMMRRLTRAPLITQLVATVGLMAMLLGIATTIWNPNESYPIQSIGGAGGIRIAGVLLTWHRVVIIAVALAMAAALRWLLFRTKVGISMRAVVDDNELASLNGIRAGRISSLAWVIGCVTAALAGILISPEVGNMSAETLSLLIINAFAAAVFGRLRSLPLTYLGALLLGLLVSFTQTYLNLGGRWVQLPGSLPAIALFVVLLALPEAQIRLGRTLRTYHIERVPTLRSAITAGVVMIGAVLLLVPVLSTVNLSRLTTATVVGVIVLGLVPLIGWAGIPFFAPYALAGFGAWFTWKVADEVPALVALAFSAVATAVVGVIAALPALRLRGLYLALSSIAFALVAVNVIFTMPELFANARQLERPSVLGIDLTSTGRYLVFAAVVYVLLAIVLVLLRRSSVGRRLVATRDSEAAAACLGINMIRQKLVVFAIAGAVAGIGGGLLAYGTQFIAVEQFPMIGGLAVILSLMIWGIGTVSGPFVSGLTAAAFVAITQDWARGDWTHALELVGPGLAAIALINHPRGQIPELADRTRQAPWGTVWRVSGLALGAVLGVKLHLPGLVGFLLAVSLYISADVLYGLYRTTRRRTASPATEPGPPELGLTVPFTPAVARRLEAAMKAPVETVRP